jgi:hypothetical protein
MKHWWQRTQNHPEALHRILTHRRKCHPRQIWGLQRVLLGCEAMYFAICLFYREDGDRRFLRNIVNTYQTVRFHVSEDCNIQVSLPFLIREKIVKMSTKFIAVTKFRATIFFFQWLYSPFLGPGLIFQFLDLFTQTVGLLGRGISPSQGLYLYTGQHKHRKTHKHINIHASSRIQTYDHGIRASEDSSCLRPLGYRDRWLLYLWKQQRTLQSK